MHFELKVNFSDSTAWNAGGTGDINHRVQIKKNKKYDWNGYLVELWHDLQDLKVY